MCDSWGGLLGGRGLQAGSQRRGKGARQPGWCKDPGVEESWETQGAEESMWSEFTLQFLRTESTPWKLEVCPVIPVTKNQSLEQQRVSVINI